MNNQVQISNAAFIFCRYSVTLLIWLGFFLKMKELILLSFIILFLSFLLKIKKAPMIFFYTWSIDKIFPSKKILLNEKAMRFAHGLGSFFAALALLFLYFINLKIGWGIVFAFAIIKSISALGFCPAYKLFGCMTGGNCCVFNKK